MRILIGDDWQDGYLDEHRPPGAVRVRVHALCTVEALRDLYFVRERSLWRVWNYLREVGLVWVVRKVLSRSRESSRNQKFLSVGCGVVLEAPQGSPTPAGSPVAFVAPCHPRALERLVLPQELVHPMDGALPVSLPQEAIALIGDGANGGGLVEGFGGWSAFSGRPLDPAGARAALTRVEEALAARDWSGARRLPVPPSSPVAERDGSSTADGRPSAVLFGYGNYGKTVVLSNVRRALRVAAIHEIDPTLLPPGRDAGVVWDTAGGPRDDERYDVYLIASYHHTHAELAAHALRQGATAVVEKPIATSREQLDALLAAVTGTGGRFFAGFHKRYSRLNDLALRDLGTGPGDPIHYHAIAFEEPLPARHWYRWPSSCSRIVSNACHWLDHFLYLNGWSEPVGYEVARSTKGGEVANITVRLANGAFGSLLLTDTGSPRVGVRDHIELRAGDVTVTIDDSTRYLAESGRRILRRARANKMTSYETMYRTIADRIARGEAGDTPLSIRVSTSLVLEVEQAFRAALR